MDYLNINATFQNNSIRNFLYRVFYKFLYILLCKLYCILLYMYWNIDNHSLRTFQNNLCSNLQYKKSRHKNLYMCLNNRLRNRRRSYLHMYLYKCCGMHLCIRQRNFSNKIEMLLA